MLVSSILLEMIEIREKILVMLSYRIAGSMVREMTRIQGRFLSNSAQRRPIKGGDISIDLSSRVSESMLYVVRR